MAAAPPQIYTLSLHDALPICELGLVPGEPQPELRRLMDRLEEQLVVVGPLLRRLLQREQFVRPEIALVVACALADRKSTRLNSSHLVISYAVFCLKKKTTVRG